MTGETWFWRPPGCRMNHSGHREDARITDANAVMRACRDMSADRVLDTVAERAPDGFTNIEDVLTADEQTRPWR